MQRIAVIDYGMGNLRSVAKAYEFDVSTPFKELPSRVRKIILYGSGDELVEFGHWRGGARKAERTGGDEPEV